MRVVFLSISCWAVPGLETESDLGGDGPRRYIVRTAERRQEVIECQFVGHVDGRDLRTPFVFIAMEQVFVADGQIKQTSRRDARWVAIGVLRARRRNLYQVRPVLRRSTSRKRRGECRMLVPAE